VSLLAIAGANKYDMVGAGAGYTTIGWTRGTFLAVQFLYNFSVTGQDASSDLWLPTGTKLSHQYTYIRHGLTITELLDAGQAETKLGQFWSYPTGNLPVWTIKEVSGNNRLSMSVGGQSGDGSTNLQADTDYLIELQWNNAPGNAGTATLKLNGATEISLSECTTIDLTAKAARVLRFGDIQAKSENRGLIYKVYEIALGDGAGIKNNTWLSAFQIGRAQLDGDYGAPYDDFTDYPSGSGKYVDWDDPASGHDSDSTYNQSATSGDQEQLSTLQSASAAGIDAVNYHLEAVRIRAVHKEPSALTGSSGLGLLVYDGGLYKTALVGAMPSGYDGEALGTAYALCQCYESRPSGPAWTNAGFADFAVGCYRENGGAAVQLRCTAISVALARLAGGEPGVGPAAQAIVI
jgi:hypothetical protein